MVVQTLPTLIQKCLQPIIDRLSGNPPRPGYAAQFLLPIARQQNGYSAHQAGVTARIGFLQFLLQVLDGGMRKGYSIQDCLENT
jgi:hypothetical protein